MENLRNSFFVLTIFFLGITTVWSAPQKNEQKESFWFWSDDEVSRKAQQIVWWQARLGEAKKKKIKYKFPNFIEKPVIYNFKSLKQKKFKTLTDKYFHYEIKRVKKLAR